MAKLSITEAWNETAAFVRRDGQVLFPLAFLLAGLPGALLQLLLPQDPAVAEQGGAWLLWLIPIFLLSFYAYLVICRMAVRGGDVSDAFSTALRRLPALVGATLLLLIAISILTVPLALIFGGALVATGASEPNPVVISVVALAVLVLALLVATRLMLTNPVAANEPVGPIAILRRSWELTQGNFWRLLGFLLLILILFMVISGVIGAVLGLVIILLAGQPEPGSFASFLVLLIGAVVNTVFVVLFAGLISRIYVQLSGRQSELADVF